MEQREAKSEDLTRGADDDVRQSGISTRPRCCPVCGRPLAIANAIVHKGACARARKTQLQRAARRRARFRGALD